MKEGVLGSGRVTDGLENNSNIRIRSDQPVFEYCEPAAWVLMSMLAEPVAFPIERPAVFHRNSARHRRREHARPVLRRVPLWLHCTGRRAQGQEGEKRMRQSSLPVAWRAGRPRSQGSQARIFASSLGGVHPELAVAC